MALVCVSSVVVSWSRQHSRKRLQIGQSDTITDRSVLIGGIRLRIGGLGVHNFEHGGLAILVAKSDQFEALRRKFSGPAQATQFHRRSFRFRVKRTDFGDELALS